VKSLKNGHHFSFSISLTRMAELPFVNSDASRQYKLRVSVAGDFAAPANDPART
jgi:hypothetical protein